MEKSKKISFTSIAIVVLAILLTVSLTMGGTLAWFANQNQAGTELTMGNAVGVAVVDETGTNGSMDKLSFTFNTGRNGELMLPGTQIDPDVRALIAKSNTDTILRAVVTFEVTVKQSLIADMRSAGYTVGDDGYMSVPSNITGSATGSAVERELYVLNQMYKSFFNSLQSSALYNGWVYRESNVGSGQSVGGSTKLASTNYYIAGSTQNPNTPRPVARTAGLGLTQKTSAPYADDSVVLYNAFYFRGWSGYKDNNYVVRTDPSNPPTGYTYSYDDNGIDGVYRKTYSNGSLIKTEYIGGGRQYFPTRAAAAAQNTNLGWSSAVNDVNAYDILEGTYTTEDGYTKVPDPLGYKAGDPTENGGSAVGTGRLNIATTDTWQQSGAQAAGEDMMCILHTADTAVRVPLFTTSFVLPTTWTQDAFADRSMRLNITFQVMQADYLASGTSHHVSVELAESRFDDVTVWADTDGTTGTGGTYKKGQPYVKDVTGQPDFDNPAFWGNDYKNEMEPTPGP